MSDKITDGLKSMIGSAATAGGMGQLLGMLDRLDGRLAHLEKTFTGSIGSWDKDRFQSVLFSTRQNPFTDPIMLKWRPVYYAGPIAGAFYSLPVVQPLRIVGWSINMDVGGATPHSFTLRRGPNDLLNATVNPGGLSIFQTLPYPYPSNDGVPGTSVVQDMQPIDILGFTPAGESGVIIFYFVEEVRL